MPNKPSFTIADKDRVLRVYEDSPNMELAAESLGVTERTLRTYFRKWSYTPVPGPRESRSGLDYHSSCIIEWVRRHPGIPLPSSVMAIAKLTGCSYDAVRCYLYRYRRDLMAEAKGLPDIRRYSGVIKTTEGTTIPLSAIDKYRISIHTRSSKLKLSGSLTNGRTFTVYVSLEDLKGKLHGDS